MTKFISMSVVTLGLLASFGVHAAGVIMTASGTATSVACTKLSGDVSVTISKNVTAAYNCDSASAIYVGACSTAGQTKSRTLSCAVVTNGVGGTATTYTGDCTTTGTAANYVYQGAVMYLGNSSGGQVSGVPITTGVGGVCAADGSTVGARVDSIAAGG